MTHILGNQSILVLKRIGDREWNLERECEREQEREIENVALGFRTTMSLAASV